MPESDINSDFALVNLTLKPSCSAIKSCIGNFTGSKKRQEIVRATNTSIELWKFNKNDGSLKQILHQNTFSKIRDISNFKIIGSNKDLLVLTSDSGNLSIVELNNEKGRFEPVSNEPYFKTGIRRLSPGEYIAIDNKNRALMIGAIEKNKLVYTLSRNSKNNKLVVSSPLEASKSRTLTYSICGMDVGFENPMFAAIETEYSDNNSGTKNTLTKKFLNFYELDLGLNHIVKKESEEIQFSSNYSIFVPGGLDGPSGILLCSKGMIQYKYPFKMTHSIPIPMRKDQLSQSQIVCGIVHRMKKSFFILLQNQIGDIFKVTLDYSSTQETEQDIISKDQGAGMVTGIRIRYFDSMPVCTSLLIFKSGFLYANCESGDQYIYQFEKLGDDPNDKEWDSTEYPDELAALEEEHENIQFEVKSFDNLNLVNIIENLNPLMDTKIFDPNDSLDLPLLYGLCGSNARSSIKILNHELPLTEIVSQDLPSKILKVFTVKLRKDDEFDNFIVLSFTDGTLILKVGEDVEEAENSGFEGTVTTLNTVQVGSSSIVQIHATGMKHIVYSSESDEPVKTIEWSPQPGIEIIQSSGTNTQVALALSNREIVYFEMSDDERLIEYTTHKELGSSITGLTLGIIPEGKFRSPFLIASCRDHSLSVLSTDPSSPLETIAIEQLSSVPNSILLATSIIQPSNIQLDFDPDSDPDSRSSFATSIMHLHIGFENGIYARLALNSQGELTNPRNKYMGPSPVSLSLLDIASSKSPLVVVHSSRTYISYPTQDLKTTPLTKPAYTSVCSFKSSDVPKNGLLAIYLDKLNIMTLDNLDNDTMIESCPIRYTPRQVVDNVNENGMLYVICSDNAIKSPYNERKQNDQQEEIVTFEGNDDDEAEEERVNKIDHTRQFGYPVSDDGQWGSCLQVFSMEYKSIGQTIELVNGEAAFKICKCALERDGNVNDYIIVSTGMNQKLVPRGNDGSWLRLYKISEDGSVEFIYKTKTEKLILSICTFQGKLLVGCGRELALYELGKKQLLRKAGFRFSGGVSDIVDLQTMGFRIVVGDIRDGVRFVVYKPKVNMFVEIVDDYIQRYVTRILMLDYETVVVGDKFGTISVLRCPHELSELSDSDNDGSLLKIREGKLNGDPDRLEHLMSFYIGDVVTGLEKGSLTIGGEECIIYSGIQGTIGILSPLKTLREFNFFKELEKLIRRELATVTDREGVKFRSYYVPVKNCIDGDLVEEYIRLDGEKKSRIANLLEREVSDVEGRVTEMRSRVGY